ncbi:MAG: NUDIX domain-containing protein [Patescibacteria group bacterium]
MSNRLPEKEFKKIFARVPRLCVDLVIQTKDGVILSKRDIEPWKGYWQLAGGSVYFGESIQVAAKRIAKEELGINIVVKKTLGYAEFLEEVQMVGRHSVSIVLLCTILSKKVTGSWQGSRIGFFKDLPKPVIPAHKKILKQIAL